MGNIARGLLDGLRLLKERYGHVKIYITEMVWATKINNRGEVVDIPRIKFIEKHLRSIKNAIKEGVNIKGYYAWSAIDLLSWLNGFKKQYGFIYVDHNNNLARKKKASYYWYKHIIETRGEEI